MNRTQLQRASLLAASLLMTACAGVNELHITSQPTGAKLHVNDKYIGQTPKIVPANWTVAGVETMRLTLSKDGYQTRNEVITDADFKRFMSQGQWEPFNSQYGLGSKFEFSYPLEPAGSPAIARAPIIRRASPPPPAKRSAPREKQKPSESWR